MWLTALPLALLAAPAAAPATPRRSAPPPVQEPARGPAPESADEPEPAPERITPEVVRAVGAAAGLEFTDEEIALMLPDVREQLAGYESLFEHRLANDVRPALVFDPLAPFPEPALPPPLVAPRAPLPEVERPADLGELLFADLPTLAALVRAREVSCEELVGLHLARLEEVDAVLHCAISILPERALARARALDAELAEGRWRGPLHGIPWGAKDLLAVRDTRTTWGAKPYADQRLELDAAVVERLDEAGAVLVAKLSLGALAWGDVWYGGRTRNPWNPEQGSSGSSAGSASAVVAGGVAFAIGSETLGSIVSPSDRCGASSLRPTFGRVSRHGAMALSWSMDKLGPLCRSLDDAALVFEAIEGRDPRDPATRAFPFAPPGPVDPAELRLGYVPEHFAEEGPFAAVLDELRAAGFELVPLELPAELAVRAMRTVLSAEAAAAFDELTRSGRDDELVRQERYAWPNAFRAARTIPAVEYVRANRLRTRLAADWEACLSAVDALVHPSFAGDVLHATNLTGHPTAVAPCGFREDGTPYSVSFTARLFGEERLLAAASAWQRATDHHRHHPSLP